MTGIVRRARILTVRLSEKLLDLFSGVVQEGIGKEMQTYSAV